MSEDTKQLITLEKLEKKKRPGRPTKVEIKPTSEEVAEIMKKKHRHLGSDPLLQALANSPDNLSTLDMVMYEFAKENASLDFERIEAERKGEDTTAISSKKIGALKALMDTWFKKRDVVVNDMFDFKDKKFEYLFEFILLRFRQSCEKSGMTEEQIQNLFRIANDQFKDWEVEAMKFIKSK